MANERLRQAMATAHVDLRAIADATGVDPKTVQRWQGGRIPHARHRWRVAELLHEREDYLWPDEQTEPNAKVAQTAEIITAYGWRSDVPSTQWWQLFDKAQHHIDLLGYAMHFLPEQLPELSALLRTKSTNGCQIRIALGDPASAAIRERDNEEQLEGTLPARIRSTLHHFRSLWGCPGIEIRLHAAPLYNSVFRCDDEMNITPHLYGLHGSKAPLLHLRRLGPNGLYSGFAAHFEAIWAISKPAEKTSLAGNRSKRTA